MDSVLPATEHTTVPWFFTAAPSRTEAVVWCAGLFATSAVLAELAGVSPERTNDMVMAAMEAMSKMPPGANPQDCVDRVLVAARDASQLSQF